MENKEMMILQPLSKWLKSDETTNKLDIFQVVASLPAKVRS
jgi:hypothetical protein